LIWKFINHEHMVEDISLMIWGLPAANRDGLKRRLIFQCPGDLVHAVTRLLDETIPREPNEIVPVAQLPLEVLHSTRALLGRRHRFDRPGIVGRVNGAYLPYLAFMNAAVKFAPRRVVAPAKTSYQ